MKKTIALFLIVACMVSCSKFYAPTKLEYESLEISATDLGVARIDSIIQPYKNQLDQEMNKVVGTCPKALTKDQPESTLGNLVADATLEIGKKYAEVPVHIGIVNYGGVRIPEIPAGEVTIGRVFELMPFDNYLVVQQLDGNTLKELLNNIASRGGWPIAGASFTIDNNVATDVLINGQPLDENATYGVALSDYLANGGDKLDMLVNHEQLNVNKLLRDAFIEYFAALQESDGQITAALEKRIVHVQ